MRIATGASSSVPLIFDPRTKSISGGILEEYMIDGMFVSNDPGYYAYIIATDFKKKQNIRILSIGTGEDKSSKPISTKTELHKLNLHY